MTTASCVDIRTIRVLTPINIIIDIMKRNKEMWLCPLACFFLMNFNLVTFSLVLIRYIILYMHNSLAEMYSYRTSLVRYTVQKCVL